MTTTEQKLLKTKKRNKIITPNLFSMNIEKKEKIKDFTFIDLFAGIGWIRMGFEWFWGECVFSSEWDEYSKKTYQANYWEIPHWDITKIEPSEIPSFNVLLAWFPCQPFSQAGLKKWFEDMRWTLFFNIAKIVEYHKPEVVFLENVKNLAGHDKGNTLKVILSTLEGLGYKVFHKILNAKDFWVPQNRARIYIIWFKNHNVNFNFPTWAWGETKLGDILENSVDQKYTISDKLWSWHQRRKIEHKEKWNGFWYSIFDHNSKYTSTISARYYKDWSEILVKQDGKNPRKLTPREAARLQGFPDTFQIPVSDARAYKQFWNSVAVPVIKALAREILKSIKNT